MLDVVQRAQAIIGQIAQTESVGEPKEHIEHVAQQALPILNNILQKYLVE